VFAIFRNLPRMRDQVNNLEKMVAQIKTNMEE
jgi:hypothetical protein